jgi:hypothetical protein
MSKKKVESNLEKDIESISLGVSINQSTYNVTSLKGKNITLNFAKESFFGVGDIWLQEGKYTCVVPDNIKEKDEEILRDAIQKGIVVLGDHFIPNINKEQAVLEEYWDYIKTFGFEDTQNHKAFSKFKKLFKYGIDRNWTAKEIVKYCISNELNYKSRPNVIKLLNQVFNRLDCPDTLSVSPN